MTGSGDTRAEPQARQADSGPVISESEFRRIQAEAAARGEWVTIFARVVPDRELEAGS